MVELRRTKRNTTVNPGRLLINQSVLIVEDQDSLSQLLSTMIKTRWGANVYIANTYKEAEEILQERASDFHVAVCEINLPDSINSEIIDLMKHHNVKSIAIAECYSADLRKIMLKKGVIDYVSKENSNAYEYVTNLVGRIFKNALTKVLIVEDSATCIAILNHSLSRQQFQVISAYDGCDALQKLKDNPDIKIIVTDYIMPKMDGFELILEVRKLKGKDEIAIIGISSSNDENIIPHFLKNGADDFIRTPFSYDELICRIHQSIENLEHFNEMRKIAHFDYLTKMHNSRYFFVNGEIIYESQKGSNGQLASVIMDIDNFKNVNDKYGHDGGDMILSNIGHMLKKHFENDLVARLGGEEFGILIKDAPKERVRKTLNDFREKVSRTIFELNGETIAITISIGFTFLFDDSIDHMLKHADDNLYKAKENGRNGVVG